MYYNAYGGVYYGGNDYRDYVAHSLGEWKIHKYIKKIGDRYIYPAVKAVGKATGISSYMGMRDAKRREEKYSPDTKYLGERGNRAKRQTALARRNYKTNEIAFKKSIAGRTISAVNSAGKAIKSAASAVKNAIPNLDRKLTKNPGRLGHYYRKGKALLNKLLGYVPGTKQNKLRRQIADANARQSANGAKVISTQKSTFKGGKDNKETFSKTVYSYWGNNKKKKR